MEFAAPAVRHDAQHKHDSHHAVAVHGGAVRQGSSTAEAWRPPRHLRTVRCARFDQSGEQRRLPPVAVAAQPAVGPARHRRPAADRGRASLDAAGGRGDAVQQQDAFLAQAVKCVVSRPPVALISMQDFDSKCPLISDPQVPLRPTEPVERAWINKSRWTRSLSIPISKNF